MNPSRPQAGLLNTSDAAHFLGVHPKTLIRWVHAGKIPVSTPGGKHFRFRREDLQAAIETRFVDAAEAAS